MHWKRKKKEKKAVDTTIAHERLLEGSVEAGKPVAKGCVPVLVGRGEERVVVPVELLKMPCMKELLDMAAMEFGYRQEGILRIPCEIEQFRQVISSVASSSKGR